MVSVNARCDRETAQGGVVSQAKPFAGQRWLVEERDACGVGFLADLQGRASHTLIQQALKALTCLEHRGACSADRDSGDGAGLMTAIPWGLLRPWLIERGFGEIPLDEIAVGMVFLPVDVMAAATVRQLVKATADLEGLTVLGWREVPVNPAILGSQARSTQPQIEQVLIHASGYEGDALERELYLLRKRLVRAVGESLAAAQRENFYVCSLSHRTIVYKGMVRSAVLGDFYLDLQNPAYESVFAIYHRRFSTNTMPRWPLAQPMRLLGHNGEINTLLGNINWMRARTPDLAHPIWGDRLPELAPIVIPENSDSANLDNSFELLVRSGRTPMEALMIMVPEAYRNQPALEDHPEIMAFYEFYSGIQEAWDGPALLVFSDGKVVGAALDRNGLRPARYSITRDGLITVASEAGVVDIPEAEIVEKGRLGPGQMIAVDLDTHEVLKNWEIKQRVASLHPYREWLANRQTLTPQPFPEAVTLDTETLVRYQTAFGYGAEDVEMIIEAMASQGKEPTFCMGDDAPLAVLSERPHILYDYFKQRFAQVTNPAIDPLRENLVMSLTMELGPRRNILDVTPDHAKLLKLDSPVLNDAELAAIETSGFPVATLSTLFPVSNGPARLEQAVRSLCEQAAAAVRAGNTIVILSDRMLPGGSTRQTTPALSAETTYIPPLLAAGAVHHHLIREGQRMHAAIVVDTAQCWSTHHFACLIGYGASAVCPYLALESVRRWWTNPKTRSLMERGKLDNLTLEQAQVNYRKATEAGLLKILSKMGISMLSSYQGAQIFEAIGIGPDLLDLGFRGTASRLGGLTIVELAQEVMSFHSRAFPELTRTKLENFGFVQYRPGGEYHMNSPEMAKYLHKAVADPKTVDHYALYQRYLQERPVTALRDLLDFQSDRAPIPLEAVEAVSEIVKRFCTGGMSLGALSREAHETLAIAMNRLGGKSNSGEGGEDPVRFRVLDDVDHEGHSPTFPHLKGLRNGDTASSAIKQVASGRFGVTPEYLMHAQQLEIKVAQGAKPGEGGQLPGKKVSPYIAYLRRSKAGVPLISPPPHHDIYSIEDLAQLIFDLHQINPQAQVSVKLVAEIGIGTVAAGVAKANADIIQISGHDGGTGASPLSSIKHAGGPWELGLTEVHRVLMENQLRDRVLLRVDGGLKTGWDVVMAALMGGEEFGFGSIAMIAEGCIMARICHTNNCPVGVATQREELRQRFTGIPEHVVNFFVLIAEEVRSILARLGYRSLQELIGRADLLKVRPDAKLTKTQRLNLDCLIQLPDTRVNRQWLQHETVHSNGPVLDDQLLADARIQAAIRDQGTVTYETTIVNTDRTVGTRVAGVIAAQYGNSGFEGQITLHFRGSAGQSFGAFILPGMTLRLTGEANDYVGKGMHGGEIIIVPPPEATYDPSQNVIIGNTCLYGATGGLLLANGQAGERFAVRNSKAEAVIEGAGDHCCEYMTGGAIVVLGPVGRNVGAGMTGGLAYFLDEAGDFPAKVNPEIVKWQRVKTAAGEAQLRDLIQRHRDRTGSPKAQQILDNWPHYLPLFWQVVPPSEADTPEASDRLGEKVAVSA
ncbi:glutamate synthase-related protein [Trichothermofontia sichuanensis B231]|uniref:glutamate synthase-related protein n=1 Tax=Trichothermofontia sichuanensis TaxID=3045816 RepID=UPI002246F6E7|nr:glutamate synthase-related protein [Trichothermofontia sichuanensis]UZQ53588.1 glutamate synthase-related protein [Trichothermofontia sichuanensis B231]